MIEQYQSDQQVFDLVVEHLSEMTKRSLQNPNDARISYCAYRDDDNNKCAIGCLIPDELYDVEIEKWSIKQLIDNQNKVFHQAFRQSIFTLFEHVSKDLLIELQAIHDSYFNWDDNGFINTERLFKLANDFNLSSDSVYRHFEK